MCVCKWSYKDDNNSLDLAKMHLFSGCYVGAHSEVLMSRRVARSTRCFSGHFYSDPSSVTIEMLLSCWGIIRSKYLGFDAEWVLCSWWVRESSPRGHEWGVTEELWSSKDKRRIMVHNFQKKVILTLHLRSPCYIQTYCCLLSVTAAQF